MKSLFGTISLSKQKALLADMKKLMISEEDIVEKFIRSSGCGGQKVNKTATCVYLKHIPSGIEVKVQRERSQSLNRFFARRLLVDKIDALKNEENSKEQQRIEKIRRQKRKRSKRAKEKILQDKKIRSKIKTLRNFKLDRLLRN